MPLICILLIKACARFVYKRRLWRPRFFHFKVFPKKKFQIHFIHGVRARAIAFTRFTCRATSKSQNNGPHVMYLCSASGRTRERAKNKETKMRHICVERRNIVRARTHLSNHRGIVVDWRGTTTSVHSIWERNDVGAHLGDAQLCDLL